MNTLIIRDIIFQSNEHILFPSLVHMEFQEESRDRLEHLLSIADREQVTIRVDCSSLGVGVLYIDGDDADFEDFRPGYEAILIYPGGNFYFYAESKYHCGDQIESSAFSLSSFDIKN